MKTLTAFIAIVATASAFAFTPYHPPRTVARPHRVRATPLPPVHHRHLHRGVYPSIGIRHWRDIAHPPRVPFSVVRPLPVPLAVPPPPVVIRNPVWVPPVYETRPIYGLNGIVIGYEQVIVRGGYWR